MKKMVIISSVIVIACSLCAGNALAESQKSPQAKKTQVVIIGTIHGMHLKNPKYSPQILKEIILSLEPDAILNELPLSQVEPNGRPIEKIRHKNNYPECWAADNVAMQLGVRQIPFDMPDRQQYYKKANHFEKLNRAGRLLKTWAQDISEDQRNSTDLKILQIDELATQAQLHLMNHSGPESINSKALDSIVKIRRCVETDILSTIVGKHPEYKTFEKDIRYFGRYWQKRNRIMADNIVKAAKEYPEKRLLVITGCEHRYILRELLKDEKSIELKEYWQIIEPKTIMSARLEAGRQKADCQVGLVKIKRVEK
jgi:hypothetical protein